MPAAYYIPEFITEQEEEQLLKQVYAVPKPKWVTLSNRRLQNWGKRGMLVEPLPDWLTWPLKRIEERGLSIFPATTPANHCLVNEYAAGQGIMPHEDGPMYLPCVATLSLGSHAVLDFTPRETTTNTGCFSLFLAPRSLFVQRDQLYELYLHGIAETTADDLSNERRASPLLLPPPEPYDSRQGRVERGMRVSLTYRRVARSINKPKLLLR
ncbi:hypothetical protein SYNPS1DRAFT_15103 [Syncephalis pseudoplumigaleata]|uniref:Fe2OG dioxygenase domain-containing protein n=1 Tax=Syncephalis pseudoplumigaleata TaxID=1712513 RepID=A0A4P9Z2W2_9FUNG|nr:hypothetical protein SYNPS1DRAFT_15103 [Syncephalis pseudoplumigaleata]|eukprot:RKP25820.1 hypothetical protein SYNPS1DRAFT_15103 [Syncephalis pseudoplumigaleata]